MVSWEEGEIREGNVVREDGGGNSPSSSSSSSRKLITGAYTALFESVSTSPDTNPFTKGNYHDAESPAKSGSTKEEEKQGEKKEEPFFSCIEPLMKKFEENLHNEFLYVDKLQNLCTALEEENKSLQEEIDAMKDFIFSSTINQSTRDRREITELHNRIRTLDAALRIEILKAKEYKMEVDDARHVLARRTRSKLKKGQMFEVIIAQKPQEVAMSSCVTPFHDEDMSVASCPICLEEFDIATGWYTLSCKHRYHLVCLAKVMPTRTRCCVCNQELHKLLYEAFGMACKYPDDARLWDAQTGRPVDFTLEEDIRAIVNEIEESQEAEQGADEEEFDEVLLIQGGEENRDGNGEDAVNTQSQVGHDVQMSQAEDDLEEEEEEEGSTEDEDGEEDEEDSEEEEEEEEEEEDFETSSEEEEDPDDPDYTPSEENV